MIAINVFVLRGRYVIIAAIVLAVMLAGLSLGTGINVFKAGGRNLPVYSVERDDNRACVTFNCAWNDGDIDSILATLDKYECKATFFVVGDWAEKYPEALKKIAEKGHEIGGHSYNHKDYTKLSAEEIAEDLRKCDEAIMNVTGVKPILFRVPSGAYDNKVIKAVEKQGKICIQWSADSIDYNDAEAEDIYNRSIKLDRGGILLMHNGTKNTALALTRVLDNLKGRFELVKISDILYADNFKLDANGCMKKAG